MSPRGNPYPHRYKFGVIKKPIDLNIFRLLMERVAKVDRAGYSTDFVQALHAMFFWTGLRKTEVLGRKPIRYLIQHKECKGKGCLGCNNTGQVQKIGKAHPGLVWEDLKFEEGFLLVYSVGENVLKHGDRQAPMWLHETLPFVDKIISRWKDTKPNKKVFPITGIAFWRICKRIDPKFTMHFYRHNRVTELSSDRKMSLANICSHTGLSPFTVTKYMIKAGRFTKQVGERVKEKYGAKPLV